MEPEITPAAKPDSHVNCPSLHVVVTCTRRKRAPTPPRLRLGSIRVSDPRARGQEWVGRLRTERAPVLSASDMYAGDHWHVARSLLAQGQPLQLWVASAGYGLVRPNQQLKPYSATFSLGPDSVLVGRRKEQPDLVRREWWASITRANLGHDSLRTLRDLAASDPGAILLVALSEPYVQALHDDLVEARAQLRGGGRLLMVSAGTRKCPGLDDTLLPVNAGLQYALGGSRLSLNVRIARHLVATSATHGWATPAIVESLNVLSSASTRPRLRRRMTDDQVVAFIVQARGKENGASRTDLLRRMRTQGLACEQQRFARLFAGYTAR